MGDHLSRRIAHDYVCLERHEIPVSTTWIEDGQMVGRWVWESGL